MNDPIRVFVGSDRSQAIAVRVLEHSIKRHTDRPVAVVPMIDLPVRSTKDPRQGQRTGFSFSRFCIPKLANYQGRAIYMDADMLVFGDVGELWDVSFDGAKVVIQDEVKHLDESTAKIGSPKQRVKQCSVMVLDCARLDWDIDKIIDGLDEEQYTYEQLMNELCILDESEVRYGVPFNWNSLEYYDPSTRLIHYTDMYTQPWVSPLNENGELWFHEVRLMLRDGALTWTEILEEIRLGYFRPSLTWDLRYGGWAPRPIRAALRRWQESSDARTSFVKHRDVYKAKELRRKLIAEFESHATQD